MFKINLLSPNSFLGIGFILSFITMIVQIPFIVAGYAALALFLYPLSLLMRTLGWFFLGKKEKMKLFYAIALTVAVLGFFAYLNVWQGVEESIGGRGQNIFDILFLSSWSIYTLFEATGYYIVRKKLLPRFPVIALLNFPIAIFTLLFLVLTNALGYDIPGSLLEGSKAILVVSSFAAFVGFAVKK